MKTFKLTKERLASIIFLMMLLVVHHYFFYPPVVEEGRTNDGLYAIGNAVSTGNQQRIRDEVLHYLDEDVQIHLEMNYKSIRDNSSPDDKPAISYDFTKSMFNAYLSNMLQSLSRYAFHAYVADFAISGDWQSAQATIGASGAAQGTSRFIAKLREARFTFDAVCDVKLDLTGSHPLAKDVRCRMFLPPPEPLS